MVEKSKHKVGTSISLAPEELAKLHDLMVMKGKRSYSATIADLINGADKNKIKKVRELKDKLFEIEAILGTL